MAAMALFFDRVLGKPLPAPEIEDGEPMPQFSQAFLDWVKNKRSQYEEENPEWPPNQNG